MRYYALKALFTSRNFTDRTSTPSPNQQCQITEGIPSIQNISSKSTDNFSSYPADDNKLWCASVTTIPVLNRIAVFSRGCLVDRLYKFLLMVKYSPVLVMDGASLCCEKAQKKAKKKQTSLGPRLKPFYVRDVRTHAHINAHTNKQANKPTRGHNPGSG